MKKEFDFSSFRLQSLFFLLLCFLFYGNTLFNQFCLDDGLVWTDNQFVKEGIKGIPDIFIHDSFYGAIGNNYNLGGGRWRPLSLITFAIEHQFYGETPWVSHLINVLLYGLTAVLLLLLLRKFIFTKNHWLAFISVFLFVIHPVHTEVVANIKSRDEILSLIFLLLTLYFTLDDVKYKTATKKFLLALFFYFLALLSKENGLMFLFIIPLTLWCFTKITFRKIALLTLPFAGVAIVYAAIRIGLIGFTHEEVKEIMDNPYLLATPSQKFATILYVFLIYYRLLFYPHPLTYDYSYNQIPYHDFSDKTVLLSIAILLLLIAHAVYWIQKKDTLSYCIFFFYTSIFIVSNIVINIGAPLGERFLYQPSVAFCIGIVTLGDTIITRFFKRKSVTVKWVVGILLLVITLPAFAKTYSRNKVWQYGYLLGTTDVQYSPHSAKANTYASINYTLWSDTMKDADKQHLYREKALNFCRKSYEIYPDFFTNYLNWGVVYSRLDSVERAEWAWNEAKRLNPNSTALVSYFKYLSQKYYPTGLKAGADKDFDKSLFYLRKAAVYDPANPDTWYNLGGVYFTVKKYDSAKICWQKVLQLNPNYTQAKQGLNALSIQIK